MEKAPNDRGRRKTGCTQPVHGSNDCPIRRQETHSDEENCTSRTECTVSAWMFSFFYAYSRQKTAPSFSVLWWIIKGGSDFALHWCLCNTHESHWTQGEHIKNKQRRKDGFILKGNSQGFGGSVSVLMYNCQRIWFGTPGTTRSNYRSVVLYRNNSIAKHLLNKSIQID